MRVASENDYKPIMAAFMKHREYFPHIRGDAILRKIKAGEAFWEDGVVITFSRYKRAQRLGTFRAVKGDTILHQIAATTQGNGSARRAAQTFLAEAPGRVVLTVRSENMRARQFYKSIRMREVGTTSWSKGTIPGTVYLFD